MSLRPIADFLGVSHETVRKHFQAELAHGRALGEKMVSRAVYSGALSGDFPAQKFLLTHAFKWNEGPVPDLEAEGPDGQGPVRRVIIEPLRPAAWAENAGQPGRSDALSERES